MRRLWQTIGCLVYQNEYRATAKVQRPEYLHWMLYKIFISVSFPCCPWFIFF